jgi:hypothetical protein
MELDGMNVGDSIQVHDEIGQTGVPNDPLVPATPTWRTGNSPGEWGGGPYLSANHLKSSSKGWNTWRKAKRNIDDIEVSWSCKKKQRQISNGWLPAQEWMSSNALGRVLINVGPTSYVLVYMSSNCRYIIWLMYHIAELAKVSLLIHQGIYYPFQDPTL